MLFCRHRHFLRLGSALMLAFVALVFASIIFFLILPHIIGVTMVFFLLVLVFIIIWIVLYLAMVLGAAVYRYTIPFNAKEQAKGDKCECKK